MTTEEFKNNWLRYLEAWNQKDMELTDRLSDAYVSPNAIGHNPGVYDFGDLMSQSQKEFARAIVARNPDFHVTVDDALVDGDRMILRGTILLNNPSSGAIESITFMEIDRIVNEQIVESWDLFVPGKW